MAKQYTMYTVDLVSLTQQHCLSSHLYADDTQTYGARSPSDVGTLLQKVTGCLIAVAGWMSANRLQLNSDKTEFVWLTSPWSQHRLPTSGPLIGSNVVSPSATVCDLVIFIDQDLTMKTHVQQTASRWFATLRQLRSFRRYIPMSVFHSLVSALVLSRLDYCNSFLIDLPLTHIQRLQSVLNATARLIFNLRRCDHITDVLISLHWLRVPERITFKVATLTYRALHGSTPPYSASSFTCVADMAHQCRLRSEQLDMPTCCQSTIAFPVAAAKVWNGLPSDVTSASLLSVFKNRLKTYFLCRCYETVWLWMTLTFPSHYLPSRTVVLAIVFTV